MINIGLPQGGIRDKSVQLIEHLLGERINPRLLHHDVTPELSCFLLKHRDIPRLVSSGVLDIGVTSSEWVYECSSPVATVDSFDWCNTRISLLSPQDRPALGVHRSQIRCVTEFPHIAERFFQDIEAVSAHIEYVSGSSEGLVPDLFDCCIDCVQTGETAHRHGLREEQVLYRSTIVLIVREGGQRRLRRVTDLITESVAQLKLDAVQVR